MFEIKIIHVFDKTLLCDEQDQSEPERPSWVDEIITRLNQLEQKMSQELDALTAAVKRNSDAEDSAIALLVGLSQALMAAKDDPAKVAALASEVNAKADAMAAAVVANTPAAP